MYSVYSSFKSLSLPRPPTVLRLILNVDACRLAAQSATRNPPTPPLQSFSIPLLPLTYGAPAQTLYTWYPQAWLILPCVLRRQKNPCAAAAHFERRLAAEELDDIFCSCTRATKTHAFRMCDLRVLGIAPSSSCHVPCHVSTRSDSKSMQSNDQYENLSSSGLRFTLLLKSLEETLLFLYQLASLRAKAAAICEAEVPRGARDLGLSDACWDLGLPDVALDCRGPLDCGADAAHICVRDHASTGRSTCRRHAHKLVTHAHTQRHTHTQAWKHTHMHAHTHTRAHSHLSLSGEQCPTDCSAESRS